MGLSKLNENKTKNNLYTANAFFTQYICIYLYKEIHSKKKLNTKIYIFEFTKNKKKMPNMMFVICVLF